MQRKITIAGGGLGGLTLGLLLQAKNVPVEILDAGTYPRHRVCGEFISGKGLEILGRLGLENFPEPLGVYARSVRFFTGGRSTAVASLPRPALSVDRASLDHLLACEFRRRGGTLRENTRWTDGFATEGLVRATGRRIGNERRHQYVGLKMHLRDLSLSADLELHLSSDGYVGLSRQGDGTVNMCGLFRKRSGLELSRDTRAFERVLARERRDAVRGAHPELETFSAVAGISLKRELRAHEEECSIGDSICMIPPLTGNGMSLAVESASIAAPILSEYSCGRSDWSGARRRISQRCEAEFHRRLLVASILQKAAFSGGGRLALLVLIKSWPGALDLGFRLTR